MKYAALRHLRAVFLAVLFVLSLAVPASVDRAEAQITRSGHEIDYYSDATFRTLVGYIIFCNSGQTIHWGQATHFSKVIVAPPC